MEGLNKEIDPNTYLSLVFILPGSISLTVKLRRYKRINTGHKVLKENQHKDTCSGHHTKGLNLKQHGRKLSFLTIQTYREKEY